MKVCSVVGTRPQIIKAAILSRVMPHDVIDTGQHWDNSLSGQYFSEFKIQPKPLSSAGDVSSMYKSLCDALKKCDTVLVYGDCNTTLAAALATKQLGKRLVHIEAGCRSYNRRMIEEGIRITVDHMADMNLCPTKTALNNLNDENIQGVLVGDLSQDYINSGVSGKSSPPIITIHRAENELNMVDIIDILEQIKSPILWPMHPKMRSWTLPDNVIVVEPVDYRTMLGMVANAPYVITDSGGLQKEAYMLKTKCITLRNDTEWTETLTNGWNTLAGVGVGRVLYAIEKKPGLWIGGLFGDGHSAERMKDVITRVD